MNIFRLLSYPDFFRLGQQDALAVNANFSEVHLDDGLYSIGEVKEDGYLASICARGIVVQDKGILLFFTIREINGMLVVEDFFDVTFDESGFKCKNNFNNQNAPKKNDIIAVFIGSNTLKKNKISLSPVLIAYKGESDEFKFFEGSNVFSKVNEIELLKLLGIVLCILSHSNVEC